MKDFLTDACGFGFEQLLEQAVCAGKAARVQTGIDGHAALYGMEYNGSDEMLAIRTAMCIAQVPMKVAKAFAMPFEPVKRSEDSANAGYVLRIPVMKLNEGDHPAVAQGIGAQGLPALDHADLAQAGKQVYAYLQAKNLQPELAYVYDGDVRRYYAHIVISVGPTAV
jgi:hypothetical protein